MKANYQSVSSIGQLCSATGQSIVECRLNGGEIASVLLCEPTVCLDQATCGNGEIEYSGKLVLAILYEDVEGGICRSERGAEFFHKAENPKIAPAHTAAGELSVQGVKLRREGGQLIISCIVEAKFDVFGEQRYTYVSGGEGLQVRRERAAVYSRYTATTTVEEEDEFECDFAKDVLLHTECAAVTEVRAGMGEVNVLGELCMRFCLLKEDGSLCSYERMTPIKAQVLLDTVMTGDVCLAKLRVLSARVSAATDEERKKSKIVLSYQVQVEVCAFEKTEIDCVVDAYAIDVEVALKRENIATRYALESKTTTERVHGTPVFGGSLPEDGKLLGVVCPKTEAALQKGENGWELQGVIEAKALYQRAEGGVEAVDVALPIILSVLGAEQDGRAWTDAEVECSVYGFGLRVRADGETEAEGTVRVRMTPYIEGETAYLSEVAEGEKKPKKTCAVSVYMPTCGEDAWTLAKRLSMTEETLIKSNPQLIFPLKGEERILVYRQKQENLQK